MTERQRADQLLQEFRDFVGGDARSYMKQVAIECGLPKGWTLRAGATVHSDGKRTDRWIGAVTPGGMLVEVDTRPDLPAP